MNQEIVIKKKKKYKKEEYIHQVKYYQNALTLFMKEIILFVD